MSTVTSEVPTATSVKGRIKFFNTEKKFGFVETSNYDMFFTPKGYRQQKIVNGQVKLQIAECPIDSLEQGLEVIALDTVQTQKGMLAVEWYIPSLTKIENTIYVVTDTTERTQETAPVSDPVRKMFVSHCTKTITEKVIYVGIDEDEANRIARLSRSRRVSVLSQ